MRRQPLPDSAPGPGGPPAAPPEAQRAVHPSGRACEECGAPLDVLQAARGAVCGRPECHTRRAVRAAEERRHREVLRTMLANYP